MIIVISKYLVPNGFLGITIFPFVILRNKNLKNDKILINHEQIHLRQQLQMLVVFFFIWYGIEFLIRFAAQKDKMKAYRTISFEKEAYVNEHNLNYLEDRKWFKFLNYLK